jgi:peptide-methionine (R)-S-oxide reductase
MRCRLFLLAFLAMAGCAQPPGNAKPTPAHAFTFSLSDEEWRKRLTPEQFRILRQKGTEPAFSGKYANHHESGQYLCAGCDKALFRSQHKFESGTGWPSFTQPAAKAAVAEETDTSYDMRRVEVMCGNCGGHLGHVFNDGPQPTGLRYCINSAALKFKP